MDIPCVRIQLIRVFIIHPRAQPPATHEKVKKVIVVLATLRLFVSGLLISIINEIMMGTRNERMKVPTDNTK